MPTLYDLEKSLEAMKNHALEHDVNLISTLESKINDIKPLFLVFIKLSIEYLLF